jgi:hypothetical protein
MKVWQVDGEDCIVAKSERQMLKLYRDFHGGDSIGGRNVRVMSPEEEIEVRTGESTILWTASELARVAIQRYIPGDR